MERTRGGDGAARQSETVAGESKGGNWRQLVWSAFRCETGRSGAARTGRVGCLPAAGKSSRSRVGHNQINQSDQLPAKTYYTRPRRRRWKQLVFTSWLPVGAMRDGRRRRLNAAIGCGGPGAGVPRAVL